MPKPITIIEPPCLFCAVHPSKKQFSGQSSCHKCDAIYRQHEHEESLRRDSVEWIYEMANGSGELIGVAVAGRPVGRGLDKPGNIEITRCCTLEHRNANSRLYGAILRAATALGYRTAYTYTLQSESGASLKAAGFVVDETMPARPTWDTPSRRRMQTNMFGEEQRPAEAKIRWKRELA